jgi:uncharacterized protein (DUF1778 family)
MSRVVERKEHLLSMRLSAADIAIIDRAATLRGRSRTQFVRDAAVRAAEDVLMDGTDSDESRRIQGFHGGIVRSRYSGPRDG